MDFLFRAFGILNYGVGGCASSCGGEKWDLGPQETMEVPVVAEALSNAYALVGNLIGCFQYEYDLGYAHW